MSDNFAPQPGPEAYERMRSQVDREIASYSAEDPSSLCYDKPEMAASLRAGAEDRFKEICARHGAVAPPPKSAEEVRKERFDTDWQAGLGERQEELIRQEIEAFSALDPAMRAHQVAELRKKLGDDYDAAVADARAGCLGGSLPDAALGSEFVLRNLRAVHRYRSAHSRARAAAGF